MGAHTRDIITSSLRAEHINTSICGRKTAGAILHWRLEWVKPLMDLS